MEISRILRNNHRSQRVSSLLLFHLITDNVQTKYREDHRCGGNFLAPNGEVAECDPDGIYPCCSPYNWCGITADHCDCTECIDYRNPGLQLTRNSFR